MALAETGGTGILWGCDTLEENDMGCCVCGGEGDVLVSCVDLDEGVMEAYVLCVADTEFFADVIRSIKAMVTA